MSDIVIETEKSDYRGGDVVKGNDFSYQLPPDLPGDYQTSGESKIAYELMAYVDIPLDIDISCKKMLAICEKYDPETIQPVSAKAEKSFLIDSSNAVEMSVFLERNMYFPGENVRGFMEVS